MIQSEGPVFGLQENPTQCDGGVIICSLNQSNQSSLLKPHKLLLGNCTLDSGDNEKVSPNFFYGRFWASTFPSPKMTQTFVTHKSNKAQLPSTPPSLA